VAEGARTLRLSTQAMRDAIAGFHLLLA